MIARHIQKGLQLHTQILFLAFAGLFSLQADAQSIAEFNQQLGACSAQTEKAKRSQCFERLAKDAVAEMDRQRLVSATPALPVLTQAKQPVSKYTDFVAKAKSDITSGFNDPSTVQWRNLFVSVTSDSKPPTLCGELNGKNAYGAYVGFKRFVANPDPLLQEIENVNKHAAKFNLLWEIVCMNKIETVE